MKTAHNLRKFVDDFQQRMSIVGPHEKAIIETDPIQAEWLRAGRGVDMSMSTLACKALTYAGLRRLTGRYGIQAVFEDSKGAIHEFTPPKQVPDRERRHVEYELSRKVFDLVAWVREEYDESAEAQLYDGVNILGQVAGLEPPAKFVASVRRPVIGAVISKTETYQFENRDALELQLMPRLDVEQP